jgi:hypothetical protein
MRCFSGVSATLTSSVTMRPSFFITCSGTAKARIKDGGRQHHQKKESLEHGRSLPLLLGQVKAPDKPPLSPFLMAKPI